MAESQSVVGGTTAGSFIVSGSAVQKDGLNKLVMVPGHGVFIGAPGCKPTDDNNWVGIFSGEGSAYYQHAEAGVKIAAENPDSLLVFSGGQTRFKAGPISEGQSYWQMADQNGWFSHAQVRNRAVSEDFARDSAENLECAMLRFYQVTGKVPEEIFVAGWEFKRGRFELNFDGLNAQYQSDLVGLNLGDVVKFNYVGVNNPAGDPQDVTTPFGGAMKGEKKVIAQLSADKLGKNDPDLTTKRLQRDPFYRDGADAYPESLKNNFRQALRSKASKAKSIILQRNPPHKGVPIRSC